MAALAGGHDSTGHLLVLARLSAREHDSVNATEQFVKAGRRSARLHLQAGGHLAPAVVPSRPSNAQRGQRSAATPWPVGYATG